MSHFSNKRAKTESTSPSTTAPLYTEIEPSQITIDATPQGAQAAGCPRFSIVKYNGERLALQLISTRSSMRVPFGIDDGAMFGGATPKATLKLELPPDQLAFFRAIEHEIMAAAVANKTVWFAAIKPLPSDDDVRAGLNSRVTDGDKYTPSLKLNVGQRVLVTTTRRKPNGKLTAPKTGSLADVVSGCRIVPVLRTAGGVWVNASAKQKTFGYGLSFEVSNLVVIKDEADNEQTTQCLATSINFGDTIGSDSEADSEEDDSI